MRNYFWNGGISKLPYPFIFNNKLKKQIKVRDNLTCQECKNNKCQLSVHHIDFNKNNNNLSNLISLCRSCHCKTQFNREDWIKRYKLLMEKKYGC